MRLRLPRPARRRADYSKILTVLSIALFEETAETMYSIASDAGKATATTCFMM